MKIKKLFHWLYAILMLLPVFYIGGRVLYTIFNKNAKDSYSQGVQYKYETNEVNSFIDIHENNIYKVTINTLPSDNGNYPICNAKAIYNYQYTYTECTSVVTTNSYLIIRVYNNMLYVQNIDYFGVLSSIQLTNVTLPYSFDVVIYSITENTFNSNLFSISNYNELVFDNTNAYLDNAFEYSVNQLNEVPLFSWAQTSFLNQPFTYISGLFGIAASNPINTMLSYWLSISIIWLVFDLVMYVPLLVHRWIDKGGID